MPRPGLVAATIASLAIACSKSDKPPPPPDPAAVARPSEPAGSGDKPHHRKHEDRRDPAVPDAPPLELTVAVDGAAQTWRQDAFDKVARFTGNTRANDGEARDVWSLRELVHTLVGPTARATAVTGDDGTRAIDRAAWDDAARTPLLHTTRRGTLKFRWADAAGAWGETEIKDVTKIELAR
ncbi:MAG TPA: hypothetical protein VF469_04030 [Kofleriaceae bacterium]